MSNEELFDTSSEIFDSLSDSELDSQADPVVSELDSTGAAVAVSEPEQGSDNYDSSDTADTSCVYTVVMDQRATIEELQRIEGVNISILYTLYICIGIFLSIIILKIIWYFAKG